MIQGQLQSLGLGFTVLCEFQGGLKRNLTARKDQGTWTCMDTLNPKTPGYVDLRSTRKRWPFTSSGGLEAAFEVPFRLPVRVL